MRFLLVLTIWIFIVGGLWSYISYRDDKRQQITASTPIDLSVDGQFSMEVTPTFSIEADPFSLTTSEASASSFEIKLNGNQIPIDAENVQRGQAIRHEDVTGILAGHNEIYIAASPPHSENTIEHGVRVKLYQDTTLLLDKTVWTSQGALLSETISFRHLQNEEGSHDH